MEEKDLKVIGFDDPNNLAAYGLLECFKKAVVFADAVVETKHADAKKLEEITKRDKCASNRAYRIVGGSYVNDREKGVPRTLLIQMQKYAKRKSNPSSDWLTLLHEEFEFDTVESTVEWAKMVFHQLGFDWDGTTVAE